MDIKDLKVGDKVTIERKVQNFLWSAVMDNTVGCMGTVTEIDGKDDTVYVELDDKKHQPPGYGGHWYPAKSLSVAVRADKATRDLAEAENLHSPVNYPEDTNDSGPLYKDVEEDDFEYYEDELEEDDYCAAYSMGEDMGEKKKVRRFSTGATRDTDQDKIDYDGFLSPLALKRFGEYMHKHRKQSDGSLRASDNWKKGIPVDQYMKSMFRHFMEVWSIHGGHEDSDIEESLAALLFNVQGMLHEIVKERKNG